MIGNAVFDVIARLDGVGQLLIVGTGILQAFQLGSVQSDPLSHLIDGFAAVFPGQVDINIHAFTGIDETGHPAAPDRIGIAIGFNVEDTEVSAIHDKVIVVAEIQAPGSNEVCHPDMRDRIHANHLPFCRHGIHDDAVDPAGKGFIYTGTPVKEHIEDLCCCFIRILMLDDAVAALQEIRSGILFCGHEHAIDLGIVVRLISADGLILINQKEAPGKRFSGSYVLDQPDVILTQSLTLLIIFRLQLFTDHGDMLIGVRLSGNGLELQLHGRDLQPAGKGRQDIVLLLRRTEHKVNGFDFKDLDIPAIRGLHDAVSDILDREKRLNEFKLFGLSSFCLCDPAF